MLGGPRRPGGIRVTCEWNAPPAIEGTVCRGERASGRVSRGEADDGVAEWMYAGRPVPAQLSTGPGRPDWHASLQLERVQARQCNSGRMS